MLKQTEQFQKLTRNHAQEKGSSAPAKEHHRVIFRKSYPRFPSLPLPEYRPPNDGLMPLLHARYSVRAFRDEPLLLKELSYLLMTTSIVDQARFPERRTYPSAGARFPVELYVFAFSIDGLALRTVHHFNSATRSLEYLWELSEKTNLSEILTKDISNPALAIILTVALQRSEPKYGFKAYPFSLIEAGHVAQNLLLGAAQLELGACPVGGFTDKVVAQELDLIGDEFPVYVISFGKL